MQSLFSLHELRDEGRPLVIAEVAQAHDGSLGAAHAFIEAAATAGADAIKFQTHIAAAESTRREQFRVRFSKQDSSRYDYWRRMEFSLPQWKGLAAHASDVGLTFLSSPFSDEACDLLQEVGMAAWKIASGELSNIPLLQKIAGFGSPVLMSSGMSDWDELDRAVDLFRSAGAPIAVMQCTSEYPTPAERVGLNLLGQLRERYKCPVGLSDHSGTVYSGLAAAAMGARLIEVHITMSRAAFGPDVPASLTIDELRALSEGVGFIHRALTNPVDKNEQAESLVEMREIFGRSIVASRPLPIGHRLTEADLLAKKPGGGLPPQRLKSVLGRQVVRPLEFDQSVSEEDLE